MSTKNLFALIACTSAACAIKTDSGTAEQREPFVAPPTTEYIPQQPAATRRFTILHTNDEHSHLLGFGPVSEYPFSPTSTGGVDIGAMVAKIGTDDQTVGGSVRMQYLLNRIRSEATNPVLTLSGGDVMMGTILHLATTQASLDYVAMTALGYDFAALGNHEFDFGTEGLADALEIAHSVTFGGAVRVLASNIHFDDMAPGAGERLADLYGPGDSGAPIMPWATQVLANGLKIGFMGLLGYDAALVAPGKTPLSFSTPRGGADCSASACGAGLSCVRDRCVNPLDVNGHIAALAADAQAVVNELRNNQGVDVVISLNHLGFQEDQALATLTDGIDIIIGGHSHQEVAPTVVNGTIIVQAGEYNKKLGQLDVTVAPDGTVGFDTTTSRLHAVDYTLDTQIAADDAALEAALTLTSGLIAPAVGEINAAMSPAIQNNGILDTLIASDHDVIGDVRNGDSNLAHLVTDAVRAMVMGGACLSQATRPVVAVQANGVLRESLRFGNPIPGSLPTATFDDIFRVVPLGASPYSLVPAPGYPLVMFHLNLIQLLAGADVGIANGVIQGADSFFLSYAGARITYDPSRSPFDQTDLDDSGYVTRIELGPDFSWVVYDLDRGTFAQRWQSSTGAPIDPSTTLITIITNLYLAGFLDAFGLTPLDFGGAPYDELWETVLCSTGRPSPSCGTLMPSIDLCTNVNAPNGNGGAPPWGAYPATIPPVPIQEVKEWYTLYGYLVGPLGGTVPSTQYVGTVPAVPRVTRR